MKPVQRHRTSSALNNNINSLHYNILQGGDDNVCEVQQMRT